ncbi:MAG: hypothetical protein JO345_16090 [Streptosporangiaceae bacterium]|nr:hypothetical protein [Streptosporangiaceae bacterium]
MRWRGPRNQRLAGEILERRYRRLLALYPSDYRAAYADEMLGVALARSGFRAGHSRVGRHCGAWRRQAAVVAADHGGRDRRGRVGWGAMLMAIGRCRPEVRRRVVVLLLPTAATAALVTWTFGGFLASSPRFVNPVALNEAQWTALALVPVAVFTGGLFWLRRYERFLSALSAK